MPLKPRGPWLLRALLVLALCCWGAQAQAGNATCPDGFAGPACSLCQTDDACRRSLRAATATCSRALTIEAASQAVKSYACALPPDGLLGSLLQPGSLLVQCTPGSAACTIGFTVKSPPVAVSCQATSCTFVDGAASLTCANTTCACPADATCGNNTLISGLVNGVKGQASLDCNATAGATNGTCVMKIAGLPVPQIDATCEAAACLPQPAGGTGAPAPAAAAPRPEPVPAPTPAAPAPAAPKPTPAPAPVSAQALVTYGTNGACEEGWTGNSCVLCGGASANAGNGACITSTANPYATCANDLAWAPNSVRKSWSCDLAPGDAIANLIEPGSMLVQCRTGLQPGGGQELVAAPGAAPPAPAPEAATAPAPAAPAPAAPAPPKAAAPAPAAATPVPTPAAPAPVDAPANASANPLASTVADIAAGIFGGRRLQQDDAGAGASRGCSIAFRVKSPKVAVQCEASDCIMNPGTSFVQCTKTACSCPGDPTCGGSDPTAALIRSLIGSVTSSKLSCEPSGACKVELGGLPVAFLSATCQSAECLVPTNATIETTEVVSQTKLNTNPVIAAIPLMVLTLIMLVVGGYSFTQRHMWGYRITGADLAAIEALAAKPAAAGRRVGTLTFDRVTVSVPLSAKEAEKKAEALRRKALQSDARAGADGLGEHHGSGLSKLLASAKHKLHLGPTGVDMEHAGSGGAGVVSRSRSLEGESAAAAAADYVVGLHQAPGSSSWFILQNCSGVIHGGQVVGLLGPSGCGKTTLLSMIAGSVSDLGASASVGGAVEVDGHRRRKSHVAYVPQSDVLIPSLTVAECLRYSALLRLPPDTTPLDLQVAIERVLDDLGLRHIADAQVGGSGGIRGVSGGERRRVTIGMELVTDPSILVLDEPTSGLDSYTADNLMRSLKGVAAAGRVVLASLHQPSKDVLFSLDSVVLMGHGRILYMGPPSEAEVWFSQHGVPCPGGTAIAEHMLHVASDAPMTRHLLLALDQEQAADAGDGTRGARVTMAPPSPPSPPHLDDSAGASLDGEGKASADSAEKLGLPTEGLAVPAPSPFEGPLAAGASQLYGSAAAVEGPRHRRSTTEDTMGTEWSEAQKGGAAPPRRGKAGYGRQLAVLFWRTFTDIVRNPSLALVHSVVGLLMGLITGLMLRNSDDTNQGVQNRMGGTFFALAFLGFTSLTTIDLLINERQVVTREVRGGYYHPSAYLVSKLTLDAMLLRVIPAILYFFPFYYLASFNPSPAYAAGFCFVLIVFSCVVGAMSMNVTVASNTAGQASFAMNFLLLFSLMFTGFLINVNTIPAALAWIHYLSVFYYAFEAMITNEMSGQLYSFQAAGAAKVDNVKGEMYLQTLGLDPSLTTRDIGILVGVYFGLVLLALALFFLRLPRQRAMDGGGRARRAAHATQSFVRRASAALGQRVASLPALARAASARVRDSLPRSTAPTEPAAAASTPPAAAVRSSKRFGSWELAWGGGSKQVAADATAPASPQQPQQQISLH